MLFELYPRTGCAVKLVTGVKLGLHGSGLLVYLIKQPVAASSVYALPFGVLGGFGSLYISLMRETFLHIALQ